MAHYFISSWFIKNLYTWNCKKLILCKNLLNFILQTIYNCFELYTLIFNLLKKIKKLEKHKFFFNVFAFFYINKTLCCHEYLYITMNKYWNFQGYVHKKSCFSACVFKVLLSEIRYFHFTYSLPSVLKLRLW